MAACTVAHAIRRRDRAFQRDDRRQTVAAMELIKRARLKYLQIGVGSEISCMVNGVCRVANTRTIWTHLVIKHGYDVAKADEELELYREADVTSEMAYVSCQHEIEVRRTEGRLNFKVPGGLIVRRVVFELADQRLLYAKHGISREIFVC
jgi:hypothetical protein